MKLSKLNQNELETELSKKFLNDFIAKHGRRPRVLHIGNVANNAYNNAKILNSAGIESDVICYDYYHIMACPEWEDFAFDINSIDQFKPDWKLYNLEGFKRPKWFAQGPLFLCMEYLISKSKGNNKKESKIWRYLSKENNTYSYDAKGSNLLLTYLNNFSFSFQRLVNNFARFQANRFFWDNIKKFVTKIKHKIRILYLLLIYICIPVILLMQTFQMIVKIIKRLSFVYKKITNFLIREDCLIASVLILERISNNRNYFIKIFIYIAIPIVCIGIAILSPISKAYWRFKIDGDEYFSNDSDSTDLDFSNLIEEFANAFPNRLDGLSQSDFTAYTNNMIFRWKKLFDCYDIVQGYATDTILPMIANKHPYFAYEHGTIREIPFNDKPISRLTALSYKLSDGVFVTNTDNIAAATKLGIESSSYWLPHAFDYRKLHVFAGDRLLSRSRNKVFRIFSPCRQHWLDKDPSAAKGNDILIKALPILISRGLDFVVNFVEWGRDVDASKKLISELNLGDYVEWLAPMHKRALWEEYLRSDVVVDQFLVSAVSGVTFEALSLGCPVITADDGVNNEKFFSEPPPLLSAFDSDQVAKSIESLYWEESVRLDIGRKSIEWIKQYHSPEKILDIQVQAYNKVL